MEESKKFIRYALSKGALELVPKSPRKLKSGRYSPYFFNSGRFDTADALRCLIEEYAAKVLRMTVWKEGSAPPGVIYGPPYKGIPLAVGTALRVGQIHMKCSSVGWATHRKEEKTHGDGGFLMGHPLAAEKIILVDDVITSGGSLGQAVQIIRAAHGSPVGCVIAFDRQERGEKTELSAVKKFVKEHGIPVEPVATLGDLIETLRESPEIHPEASEALRAILAYKEEYGVT